MSSRNDIQSAVKRNLHNWTQWRVDVNRRLTEAVLDGTPFSDRHSAPLHDYLTAATSSEAGHPAEHPRTLLAYSAAQYSETCMDQQNFLNFGIPRAKVFRYPENGQTSYLRNQDIDDIIPDYNDLDCEYDLPGNSPNRQPYKRAVYQNNRGYNSYHKGQMSDYESQAPCYENHNRFI